MGNKIKKLTSIYENESLSKRFVVAKMAKEYGDTTNDYNQAIRHFEKLVNQQEDELIRDKAILELTNIKRNIKGWNDYEYLDKLFDNEIAKGNSLGYYLIGHFLFIGNGIYSRNVGLAIDYLEKAAKMNNFLALNELGNIYVNGLEPVQKEYEKGVNYYTLAAELGHVDSMFDLGVSLTNIKELTFFDEITAEEWFIKAYEGGHPLAKSMLDRIYKVIDERNDDPTKKKRYIQ